jgi:hypothetical protein
VVDHVLVKNLTDLNVDATQENYYGLTNIRLQTSAKTNIIVGRILNCKIFFYKKCQTSKLESKNYKQATPYVIPSPVITGISGIRSNFIVPFVSWLFTKKNRKTVRPPTHKAVTTFLSTKIN